MHRAWSGAIDWLGGHSRGLMLSGLTMLAGGLAFLIFGRFVASGQTLAFDDWVLLSLRRPDNLALPIGPTWVADVARDITALGSTDILWLVTLGVAGFLGLDDRRRAMLFVLTAVGSGWGLSFLLKDVFQRTRPMVVPHLMAAHFSSFPSGHSMMAAIVYFTLGSLLASLVPDRRLKFYLLTIAAGLSILVGISRLVLGVHYPTDVVAGWLVGLAWATICERVERRLVSQGTIEPKI